MKIFDYIDYNRWLITATVAGLVLWLFAFSCTPITTSPISPADKVNAAELELEFAVWQKGIETTSARFDYARADLARQQEKLNRIEEAIIKIASTNFADFGTLFTTLLGSGVIGLLADNIRKDGVIGGLKRNK
jgi:hypothetical protein